MKKIILSLMLMITILLVGCSGDDSSDASNEDEIVLKFGTHLTDHHNLTETAVIPWMDRVTELTDGQVTFEHYPNSQMGKAEDSYELVKNGTLDLSFTLYMEDVLPIIEMPMLPNLYEDPEIGTLAFWEVLNQEPFIGQLKEKGLKPVMGFVYDPYTIGTTDEKPETLDDFSKLKLRTPGGLHDIAAEALGITAVDMSTSETLEALRKSTVDGSWGSTASWSDYQYTDELKYGIKDLPLNGWGGIFAMNDDVYESLPDDVKEAIETADKEMSEELSVHMKEYTKDEAWKLAEEGGVEAYTLEEDVIEEIKEKLEPITETWLEKNDDRGFPATEIYNQFLESYDKLSE